MSDNCVIQEYSFPIKGPRETSKVLCPEHKLLGSCLKGDQIVIWVLNRHVDVKAYEKFIFTIAIESSVVSVEDTLVTAVVSSGPGASYFLFYRPALEPKPVSIPSPAELRGYKRDDIVESLATSKRYVVMNTFNVNNSQQYLTLRRLNTGLNNLGVFCDEESITLPASDVKRA